MSSASGPIRSSEIPAIQPLRPRFWGEFATISRPNHAILAPAAQKQFKQLLIIIVALVLDGLMTDESWHNDTIPHFERVLRDKRILMHWIEMEKPEDRENSQGRYWVPPARPDGTVDAAETLLDTDDIAESVTYIHERVRADVAFETRSPNEIHRGLLVSSWPQKAEPFAPRQGQASTRPMPTCPCWLKSNQLIRFFQMVEFCGGMPDRLKQLNTLDKYLILLNIAC
jgi:hypothetical protein